MMAPQRQDLLMKVCLLLVFASTLGSLQAWATCSTSQPNCLDPNTVPKYVTPLLVLPPAIADTTTHPGDDYYTFGARQFQQQMLPSGFPLTTVWGYGPDGATSVCNPTVTTNC